MMNKLFLNLILVLLTSMTSRGERSALGATTLHCSPKDAPRRISGQIVDLGKVHPIYMIPGMATLVEIPDEVTGIRLGNPASVQYFQPESPKNEVTLVLKKSTALPTNLIIRSGKRKYIFDIVPSKCVHQDMLEVVGAFGGAHLEGSSAVLIDSSDAPEKDQTK